MSSKTQYVHGILDRSGSMSGKIQDVIGGFKTNIEEMKKNTEDFDIFVSVKMFDNEEETLLESLNIKMLSEEVIEDVMKNYTPRGQTAIRDSLGNSLTYFINKYKEEEFKSCIVYMFTDGFENASKKFSASEIKSLVSKAESSNIQVVYIGANQDAILNAKKYGISPGLALNYSETAETVDSAYRALSAVVQRARSGNPLEFTLLERSASYPADKTEQNNFQFIGNCKPPPIRRS